MLVYISRGEGWRSAHAVSLASWTSPQGALLFSTYARVMLQSRDTVHRASQCTGVKLEVLMPAFDTEQAVVVAAQRFVAEGVPERGRGGKRGRGSGRERSTRATTTRAR